MTQNQSEALDWNNRLDRILGHLAGHASMCWEPKPKGVYDPKEALKAVREAEQDIKALIKAEQSALLNRIEEALPEQQGLKNRGIPLGQWAGYNKALAEVRQILQKEREKL